MVKNPFILWLDFHIPASIRKPSCSLRQETRGPGESPIVHKEEACAGMKQSILSGPQPMKMI